MLKKGFSKHAIAAALGKCERSIYYEINRGLFVQRAKGIIGLKVYLCGHSTQKMQGISQRKGSGTENRP